MCVVTHHSLDLHFCRRPLHFHQTLVGSEVSFLTWGILCMHISESVKFSVFLCWTHTSWTQYDCQVCIFLNSCTDIVSSAKFVMIVEKDATFQRLLDDDFCTKLSPCIIITVCFLFATLLFDGRMWDLNPIHPNVTSSLEKGSMTVALLSVWQVCCCWSG